MNKLLVVEDKKINSGEYNLEINKDVSMSVLGDTIIHDINSTNKSLDIRINDNSSLDLYQIKNLKDDYYIHITLLNNAKLKLNMLILNENKHQVKIDIDMIKDNALAVIDVRAININDNNNLDIICTGYIKNNTRDNELIEDLKGLITKDNDTIKISPIMKADTNEVTANHLVTIGTFRREELFYLESLGLSSDVAKKILIESFIKHNMSSLELEFLKLGGENNE